MVSGVVSEARDASAIQSPTRPTKTETVIVRSGHVRGGTERGVERRREGVKKSARGYGHPWWSSDNADGIDDSL